MKHIRCIWAGAGLTGAFLLLVAATGAAGSSSRLAAQNPATGFRGGLAAQNPVRSEGDRGLDGAPLNPLVDLQRRAERDARDKRFKELKTSAAELADLSRKVSDDIEKNGQDVISAKVFENLDKIEKLVKQVRNRAKDGL